jgi:hypothetical protein
LKDKKGWVTKIRQEEHKMIWTYKSKTGAQCTSYGIEEYWKQNQRMLRRERKLKSYWKRFDIFLLAGFLIIGKNKSILANDYFFHI